MRNYILTALVSLAIGGAVTKLYWPSSRTTEVEVTRNDIVTEVRETTAPNGSKRVVTVIKDKTVRKETNTVVVASNKPKYHLSLSATRSANDLLAGETIIGAQIDYNILGPITVGVRADSSKQVGVTLGVAF